MLSRTACRTLITRTPLLVSSRPVSVVARSPIAFTRISSPYSTASSNDKPSLVASHDDAAPGSGRDMDPEGFQTPYTNLPPIVRDPNESLTTIRARLTYQARKRGILETDLLLSTFAKENLGQMTLEECKAFDKLMDEPDWDIYYWVTGKKDVPERWQEDKVFARIVKHAKNEAKVVLRMPSL